MFPIERKICFTKVVACSKIENVWASYECVSCSVVLKQDHKLQVYEKKELVEIHWRNKKEDKKVNLFSPRFRNLTWTLLSSCMKLLNVTVNKLPHLILK
jgi:hypothetical protein